MDKIIHRIIKYQRMGREAFDIHKIKEKQVNDYILISCMDKRIIPNDFTKVPIGHLYVVRNAGNFVPRFEHHNVHEISSEGGAIELAVEKSGIRDIIVSGHSDCKAMDHLWKLNQLHSCEGMSQGPLTQWVRKFGQESWNKFQIYLKNPKEPIKFQLKPPPSPLCQAFIDEKLSLLDRLSQINCLQQSENVATFPFLRVDLLEHRVKIHTLWKALRPNGEDPILFLFDANEKRFLKISEEYSDKLTKHLEE